MARISVAREVHKPQDFASDGTDAVGFVQFWGNSPALDLLADPRVGAFGPSAVATSPGQVQRRTENKEAEEPAAEEEADDPSDDIAEAPAVEDPAPCALPEGDEPVNILVAGGADLRHLMRTLARHRLSPVRRKLRFFLHETHHEVLARHLLFLQVINNQALPVRERMETFLSLYGNALVRERDSVYVGDIASEFVELITDNSSHPLAELVDLSHLRFKDRDALQEIFKGWGKDVPFDVEALREQRLRGYYRERYDYRKNLMDWDYQSFIKNVAGIINWQLYKEFCFTGVAFEARLASYNAPNRTLASYTEATDRTKGTTVLVRGFWADIINSPYQSFGITTDPEHRARLFKITGSQYRHTCCDIAEFNVTAYLSQMETGQAFHLPPERPEEHVYPYASPLEEMQAVDRVTEVKEAQPKDEPGGATKRPAAGSRRQRRTDWPPLLPAFEGVEVVLLTGKLSEVLNKTRYKGLFHRAFLGSMAVMPLFEEVGITKASEDPFKLRAQAASPEPPAVQKPPRLAAPELFGQRRAESAVAGALADGAEVVFETMKYQAHFDGVARLALRHRIAQAGHLAGWRLCDERRALPKLERDMKEQRARDSEKDATDFLRFVVSSL